MAKARLLRPKEILERNLSIQSKGFKLERKKFQSKKHCIVFFKTAKRKGPAQKAVAREDRRNRLKVGHRVTEYLLHWRSYHEHDVFHM